ncbi:hypothetical protein GJ496_011920 [Pomphorhynchus laevis]|nr:hypothetical protein GJ496_011920 [Pomphorhynchus laevis]
MEGITVNDKSLRVLGMIKNIPPYETNEEITELCSQFGCVLKQCNPRCVHGAGIHRSVECTTKNIVKCANCEAKHKAYDHIFQYGSSKKTSQITMSASSCIYHRGFDAAQSSIHVKDIWGVVLTNSTYHTAKLEEIIVTQQNMIITLNDTIRTLTKKIEDLESIFCKSKNALIEKQQYVDDLQAVKAEHIDKGKKIAHRNKIPDEQERTIIKVARSLLR